MAMRRTAAKKTLPKGTTFWYYSGSRNTAPVPVQVYKETETTIWIESRVNSNRLVAVSRRGHYPTKKAAFDKYVSDWQSRVDRLKEELKNAQKELPKAQSALKSAKLEARRKDGAPKKTAVAARPKKARKRARRRPSIKW